MDRFPATETGSDVEMIRQIRSALLSARQMLRGSIRRLVDIAVCATQSETDHRKVLIVRLDAIGDFVLWSEAARALRDLYPKGQFHVTLLGNQSWVALARELDIFDDVWALDRQQFWGSLTYRFRLLRQVRRSGFGVAICPTFSREFFLGDAVIRTSGASVTVGSVGDTANILPRHKRISDRWYTTLVSQHKGQLTELERNVHFVRSLGGEATVKLPRLPVPARPFEKLQAKDYYVLVPGAGWTGRQWPLSAFAQLVDQIHRTTGWTGVLCGGPGEQALGSGVVNQTTAPMINLIGKTTLPEMVRVLASARLVICNESSAVHISAAVETPAVCILGGGHYGRFIPYQLETPAESPLPILVTNTMSCFGCNWNCLHQISDGQPVPCIKEVTLEQVWSAVFPLLQRQANS